MSISKKAKTLTLVSLVLVVASYFAPSLVATAGLCTPRQFSVPTRNSEGKFDLSNIPFNDCNHLAEGFFAPLTVIALALFLIAVVLMLCRESTVTSWFRFSKYYLPLMIVLTFLAPIQPTSFLFPIDREIVAWYLSILFFVVSLILIVYKQIRSREQEV